MKGRTCGWLLALMVAGGSRLVEGGDRRQASAAPSELDRYIEESASRATAMAREGVSPGSTYAQGGAWGDLTRDPRSYRVDDLVTIVVSDSASAIARGGTSTRRKTSARNSITSLAGVLPSAGALPNLTSLGGQSQLEGQGETTRETELRTTLSARVTHVLPGGQLVVSGAKRIGVNGESQTVVVRGVCRPQDLSQSNQVRSDRLAFLEVQVNGKGVVGDAIRRPFFLYRILEGLLPF